MPADELAEAYNRGVKQGIEHSQMSPETRQKMERFHSIIEEHIQCENDKFDSLLASINKLHLDFAEFRIETKTKLDYIQEQTTKTNGRVTTLESEDKSRNKVLMVWLIRVVFACVGALALTLLQKTGIVNLTF